MGWITLALALFVSPTNPAQIPAGTVIPIMLSSDLNTTKDRQGKILEGRVMQEVPLPSGAKIPRLSRIVGHVVKLTNSGSSGSSIDVAFDTIKIRAGAIPVVTSLLAVASALSVWDAQSPINNNPDAEPSNQWVTRQVGGDVVRRGWKRVGSSEGVYGTWLEGSSVVIKISPNPKAGCSGGLGYDREQAVWVFSSAACGTYGLGDSKIESSGATPPAGQITLTSTRKIAIRGGSGWLLMVVSGPNKSSE